MPIPVLDPKKRLIGDRRSAVRADFKREYEAGTPIRVLAEVSGRSYGFVHRLLLEAGVTFRGRGGDTRSHESRKQRTAWLGSHGTK
ncbi:helix-turn-helix domain-containing protein [Streptomyces asiaticus]|uniref:helix-turn-helix domain-containing protein n=1 Tax=Streptomyces asiaticus TaxID=114695 RepID=UPI003F66DABE